MDSSKTIDNINQLRKELLEATNNLKFGLNDNILTAVRPRGHQVCAEERPHAR
jgi:hypothetical protein